MAEKRLSPKIEEDVRDLLVASFEGGSNYWYRIDKTIYPPGTKAEDFKSGGKMQPKRPDGSEDYYHWSQLIPLVPGGALIVADMTDVPLDQKVPREQLHRLNLKALRKGLRLFQEKYPEVYSDIIEGGTNWDAANADAFLQLALFGDVIYG